MFPPLVRIATSLRLAPRACNLGVAERWHSTVHAVALRTAGGRIISPAASKAPFRSPSVAASGNDSVLGAW
jgi:hypothetical protein